MRMYVCGCPQDKCCGSRVTTSNALGKLIKAHMTPQAAFACKAAHLVATGHVRTGSRTFETPYGTTLVLDKPSHFGGEMRKGKNEKGGKTGKRFISKRASGMIL